MGIYLQAQRTTWLLPLRRVDEPAEWLVALYRRWDARKAVERREAADIVVITPSVGVRDDGLRCGGVADEEDQSSSQSSR